MSLGFLGTNHTALESARSWSLLFALLWWMGAAALQLQQATLWPVLNYGLVTLAAVLMVWALQVGTFKAAIFKKTIFKRVIFQRAALQRMRPLLWGLAMAGLAWGLTGLRAAQFAANPLPASDEGRDFWVTGVVSDMPQRNASGLRFRLAVEQALWADTPHPLPQRIDVAWYGGVYAQGQDTVALQRQPPDIRAGERWRMLLRLKAPHGSRNPGGFDYELWLWEQGVQAVGYVRAGPGDRPPERVAATAWHPVAWLRQWVRDRIVSQVPAPAAGVVAALVVGDQNAIERSDWDVFRATGVAHLVSISGLHITMFAWGAAWCVGALWRRSARCCTALAAASAALWGGVLLATAYAVFSGWGVPAQRTCLMLLTVATLRTLGLRWPWLYACLLACAVVVAIDPWALLQAGFWLSFVAVGVLFASNAPHPAGAHAQPVLAHLRQRGRRWLREQWVVTVALAPLTALLFGQLSLVGLVANAFAIAWVTLVVTPLSMLGVLWPAVWSLAAWAITLWMQGLQWLAAWPWASVSLPALPLWVGALGVLGGLLCVAPAPWALRSLGLPLFLPVLLWRPLLPAPGEFSLLAADVGQGNAVLVRTAQHALLFDTGPRYSPESDAGHRVLLPLLQSLRVSLDTVLLSHRDTDHIGGAPAVLAMQPQASLLSSIEATHVLQTLRPAQRCAAGQRWQWDGVAFEILHPLPLPLPSQQDGEASERAAKPNTVSCVLRIDNGRQAALLTGDIEQAQEASLIARAAPLRATVLLVPHHGSKTSSSEAFLDAVQPRFALVQSGYRNRFGHPAAPVVQRYVQRGIVVLDSPHCGAMQWHSQAPERVECERWQHPHYWSHRLP